MSIIDHILKEKASSVYFELSRMLDEKASEIASQYKSEFDRECFEDINESPLVGNQHKIDANKNGKLDAHDFKLLRAKNDKPPFDQPYSKTKVHKDEYGNVIRNVAKRLAKKGMAANEEMSPQEAYRRKHGFYSYALKAPTPAEAIGHAMNTITAKYEKSKKKTNEETLDELSKGLLNRYMAKNYKERNRLASDLPAPGREAEATEKQKKDFAKLDKKVASGYLAHKKAFPKTWAKENPPHRRFTGDEPARVRATEEYVDEKTLTPAEMKKREEVVKAIKRDDPKMDKSMMYAIATKTAKRVAEESTPLHESEVDYNNYTITASPHSSPKHELGVVHASASPGKMKALGIHTEKGGEYGRTSKVTVTNKTTGERSHHNVYQREWGDGGLTASIRALHKPHPEHHNVLHHFLAGRKVINPRRTPRFAEETLIGKQHKLDKNKNGKIDAHDFKLLRKD